MFQEVNAEEEFETRGADGTVIRRISFETWLENQQNDDDALMRFEFFRSIFSIARLKCASRSPTPLLLSPLPSSCTAE